MIITIILLLTVSAISIFSLPQFGGKVSESSMEKIKKSKNFKNGKFENLTNTKLSTSAKDSIKSMAEFLKPNQKRSPEKLIKAQKVSKNEVEKLLSLKEGINFLWLGHSTVLINLNGKLIITDPVFSKRVSPFSFMGPKEFNGSIDINVKDLPEIDMVLISHDHYDHLDYQTIKKLKNKVKKFIVPLGVSAHLRKWKVNTNKIAELDWYDSVKFEGIEITLTPTRHFSGRKGYDGNSTLWGSYVLKDSLNSIFFGGDSGYFQEFKKIGEKYGPFDLTMLECGAYHKAWKDIHMMPEETFKAFKDLKGKVLMPIHWGKFSLSTHSWTEPVERLLNAAKEEKSSIVFPIPGEIVNLQQPLIANTWWRDNTNFSESLKVEKVYQ